MHQGTFFFPTVDVMRCFVSPCQAGTDAEEDKDEGKGKGEGEGKDEGEGTTSQQEASFTTLNFCGSSITSLNFEN